MFSPVRSTSEHGLFPIALERARPVSYSARAITVVFGSRKGSVRGTELRI
ncbi:hypothetical protein Zm00014a_009167 [Zea mays]|uniref:Uncharacterized protein n=1 Tax=Zea mays TaxID=4577 RepID=A0A3L6FDL4_MAIZE|nr:hypothetical protein Zm00014a_009167 [Zea mays]